MDAILLAMLTGLFGLLGVIAGHRLSVRQQRETDERRARAERERLLYIDQKGTYAQLLRSARKLSWSRNGDGPVDVGDAPAQFSEALGYLDLLASKSVREATQAFLTALDRRRETGMEDHVDLQDEYDRLRQAIRADLCLPQD